MKLEHVGIYDLLRWYEALIRCSHYCPCECFHRQGIPDGVERHDIYNEIVRRSN
jgi:hypothetical protein